MEEERGLGRHAGPGSIKATFSERTLLHVSASAKRHPSALAGRYGLIETMLREVVSCLYPTH